MQYVARRVRRWLVPMVMITALALGAWGGGPQPAAASTLGGLPVRLRPVVETYTTATAAYARVSMSITGTNIVRSWTGTSHTITIKNNNPYALPAVRVLVGHSDLPIDFHSLQELSSLGFTCVVLDGLALGGAKAECSGSPLGAGQELKLKLTGGTTFVSGQWEDYLLVSIYPNYPTESSSMVTGYKIAVNPD